MASLIDGSCLKLDFQSVHERAGRNAPYDIMLVIFELVRRMNVHMHGVGFRM